MGASLKDVGFNWGVLLGLTAVYFMMAIISMEKQYNRPKPFIPQDRNI
jgi:succinate-acetate transporter protein